MSLELHQILIKPVITEKSMQQVDDDRYTFEVHPLATKHQVKLAMKEILAVDAIKVNIIKSAGKVRRFGRTMGKTNAVKKAMVTLKSGQKIALFEN